MIHWFWLIPALFGGVFAGFFAAALCQAAGRDEKQRYDLVQRRTFTRR